MAASEKATPKNEQTNQSHVVQPSSFRVDKEISKLNRLMLDINKTTQKTYMNPQCQSTRAPNTFKLSPQVQKPVKNVSGAKYGIGKVMLNQGTITQLIKQASEKMKTQTS